MAFRKSCDGCQIQNLDCDCDDDIKPPKRQWPPEQCQPCVCHLVPPFNRKILKYNLPKPSKNLKSLLEPKSIKIAAGNIYLSTVYKNDFTPKPGKKRQNCKQKEYVIPSSQPVSGYTSTGVSYQYKKSEPAKLVRYCKREIFGTKPAICFTSTYQKDFEEKSDSRRTNFSKRFIFIPSSVPMANRSLVQDSYVTHPTPKITFAKKKESRKKIRGDFVQTVGPTIYTTDFVANKIERRKKFPWEIYEKSRKKVSLGKVLHASEYIDNFVPLCEHPKKPSPPTGDPCHGCCECFRPGICLPNNLNLQKGRAKLCNCHETIDYCE